MRVAMFGSTGRIGGVIFREAQQRGHAMTAIARDQADVTQAEAVARAVAGQDAVISAVGPTKERPSLVVDAARALLEGLRQASVRRLVVVGGAGSLFVKPGLQILDSPDFQPPWRASALAHREALGIYRAEREIGWTVICPPLTIRSGDRTGTYRLGKDDLLRDANGESRISIEDYAVALIDVLEKGTHERERITLAY